MAKTDLATRAGDKIKIISPGELLLQFAKEKIDATLLAGVVRDGLAATAGRDASPDHNTRLRYLQFLKELMYPAKVIKHEALPEAAEKVLTEMAKQAVGPEGYREDLKIARPN